MKATLTAVALTLLALANSALAAEPTKEVRLTAICRGRGTIETTNYNGKFLVVGREYAMVAKPSAGWIFTNWTDGYDILVTNQPRLTFAMQTNSAFIANFIKRPRLAGNLDGVGIANIPFKVLAAVNAVPAAQQPDVLAQWIETVVAVRSSALPSVLSTVVTAHPELLSPAVTAAVTSSPAQVYAIVYSVSQTPGAALAEVVAAASAAAPMQVYQIVQAVLDVNPQSGREVLLTVAATVPALAAIITGGLAGTSGPITRNQTLEILTQGLTAIRWPVNPAAPNQNPYDYSQP